MEEAINNMKDKRNVTKEEGKIQKRIKKERKT
jgi:hypothetical protein